MENTNTNAEKRVVVLHSWDAVSNKEIYPRFAPLSWGCPAVPEKINKSLIESIKDGSCFFIYAPVYKKESASL